MALEFVGDAISLSGLTGSKLKSEIIGEYYPFWWNITSGGERAGHNWSTAIVELDAATGEVYIKDTKETVLGSAGHALELKCNSDKAGKLKVVLVEKDTECYSHLKNVIARRWPSINVRVAEGRAAPNSSGIFLFNLALEDALSKIERIELGNALFFFDPLRSVEYQAIDKVANERIKTYYRTGTEFIIFLFTSDWFLGRDEFAALPRSTREGAWSTAEAKSVMEGDALFGDTEWRSRILTSDAIYERERGLVETYRSRLHRWFRYVLPMPFNPKGQQVFHLILCSNYEAGVRATRDFYCGKTGNPKYAPNNREAFERFHSHHAAVFRGLKGNARPDQWKALWKVVTDHEEGICDAYCADIVSIAPDDKIRSALLDWLESEEYLTGSHTHNPWNVRVKQYKLNWEVVKRKLGVDPPLPFKPLSLKPLSLEELSK